MTNTTETTEPEARPPKPPRMNAAIHDVTPGTTSIHTYEGHVWLDLGGTVALYTPRCCGVGGMESEGLAEMADLGRHITRLAEQRLAEIGAEACTTALDPDGAYRHHEPCPVHPGATVVPEQAKVA